jgi:regulator of sigma E protease
MGQIAYYGCGVLALAFLIVVHEAGHYFVARWCGMRIERFSIGFGPGLLKHRSAKTGTIFQIAPIPFGGFVEIRGMNLAEEVDPEDLAAYPNRPAWQRFLAILAGPATNYLAAVVLAFFVYTCHGVPGTTYHVTELRADYDAAGKLVLGDRIVAVDHAPLPDNATPRLSERINAKHGESVVLTVLREVPDQVDATGAPLRESREITLVPKLATKADGTPDLDDKGKQLYRVGIVQGPDMVDVGVIDATGRAFAFPVRTSAAILTGFYKIITREEDADVGGPGRMVEEFGKAFKAGFIDGVMLVMALSVYLGLFNLLPLPALDGGRLAFLAYEMITRRRANPKVEATVHMGGIMVLGVVLILVSLRDCHVF